MDDRLRKLERALAQDPTDVGTKTLLIAERVRLGRVTQQQVRVASVLGDPAALLLEPPQNPWWKPRDFLSVTQGEMIGYLAALDAEKTLRLVTAVLEAAFIGHNGFGIRNLTTHQAQQMGAMWEILGNISTAGLDYLTLSEDDPTNEYFRCNNIQIEMQEYCYEHGETPSARWIITLAEAVQHLIDAIRRFKLQEEERAFRNFDNVLGIIVDNAAQREVAQNFVKKYLVAYLVGDRF